MARVSDTKGRPGDIVLVRGGEPITVRKGWSIADKTIVGTVMPGSIGIIISTHGNWWTYVLWSMPCITGWVPDGFLRSIKNGR